MDKFLDFKRGWSVTEVTTKQRIKSTSIDVSNTMAFVKHFKCFVIIWRQTTTDSQIFDYHTSEALGVSDVPLPVGRILEIWGNATEVEWVRHPKSFSVTFIDDGLWDAAVDSHGEVFTHHQKLNCVEFSIIYGFVAKINITFYIPRKSK